MDFNKITIEKIVEETEDTKSFYLKIPDNLQGKYIFLPGQYITLKAEISGEEVRRAYSICSGMNSGDLAVTVKKVAKGKMSNFLHNTVKSGDNIEVSVPEGKFVIQPEHERSMDYYFVAAGSGITPVMSMIKSILELEAKSTCYLLYGSRNEKDIIFKEEWDNLEKKYKDQLFVRHTLSQPLKTKATGLAGMLGKKSTLWTGSTGRITSHKVKEFINDHPKRTKESTYYLCGPGNMIEVAESTLEGLAISKEHIKKEYFSTSTDTVSTGNEAFVTITLDQVTKEVDVHAEETILEAALRHNLDAPYSCTSGACSSCLAKKISGEIEMDAHYALEDDEVTEGFILTCQSRIMSDKAAITYDV